MRFCDIQSNQGRGRGYQQKPQAEETLIILDITKTETKLFYYTLTEKKCKFFLLRKFLTASNTKYDYT